MLFVAGVAGVIGAAVLASRATLKLEDALEEIEDNTGNMKALNGKSPEIYPDNDYRRDLTILYIRTGLKIGKLYAPAIGVGILSIAALTGSHVILTRRNVALTAAYAALDKGFREYRRRVVDEFGEEKDRTFRYGDACHTDLSEDTPNGTKIQKVCVLGDKKSSIYARFFDETSSSWNRLPNYNQLFIRCQQNYANDLLTTRGHLFLNEVYDMLGLERSKAGAVVGWVFNGDGDGFVDFGVFAGDVYKGQEFVNGNERSILLDFNVDGVIYDKI